MDRNRGIRTYLFISFGWTYTFWISAAIISSQNSGWTGIQVLHFIGGVGPLLAAITVVTKINNWRDFLSRCIKFSGFSPLIWLSIVAPMLTAIVASFISHGRIQLSSEFVNAGIGYALFLFFFGPLPEELGWRGVLFDLINQQSMRKAQVITAIVWFSWHLPLFFITGSYQHGVGFATTGFFFWAVSLVIQSIIMGYLYIFTDRSIASAILFHYVVNLAGEAFEKNLITEIITLITFAGIALTLALIHPQHRK